MNLDKIVGDIYDCAANPELWSTTLGALRDLGDFAYVMIGFMDASMLSYGMQGGVIRHSEWDPVWVQRLHQHVPSIPHLDRLFRQGIDIPWGGVPSVRFLSALGQAAEAA
jgi:hypothetical protein